MHSVCIASGLNQSVSFSIPVLFRRTTKNSSRIFSPRPKSQGYSRHLRAKRRYRDSLRVGGCDPPRHHFIVHDANPAWGIAESDDRRLQSTGIHLGHSRNEFTNRVCFPSTRVLPMRLTAIYVPEKSGKSPLFRYGTHLELFVGWRSV